jgi:hypothetical protein
MRKRITDLWYCVTDGLMAIFYAIELWAVDLWRTLRWKFGGRKRHCRELRAALDTVQAHFQDAPKPGTIVEQKHPGPPSPPSMPSILDTLVGREVRYRTRHTMSKDCERGLLVSYENAWLVVEFASPVGPKRKSIPLSELVEIEWDKDKRA